MLFHPALSIALVLAAAQAPAPAPDDLVPRSNAERLAVQLGHSIGAARQCALGDRADAARTKAEAMITNASDQDNLDSYDMLQRFREAIQEGREAVLDRTMTCEQARGDLATLEGQARY
jgi:hypothetical protein